MNYCRTIIKRWREVGEIMLLSIFLNFHAVTAEQDSSGGGAAVRPEGASFRSLEAS